MTTKIKICGITRFEDAALAASLGAWAIGYIFYEKSSRFIEPKKAGKIFEGLKIGRVGKSQPKFVGVFVNPTIEQLEQTINDSHIDTLQLHGDESYSFCEQVKEKFPKIEIIKTIRISAEGNTPGLAASLSAYQYQLVDSKSSTEWGGTGKTVDWKKASAIKGKLLILAGGLTAENCAEAISMVKPFAIDVSSGLEASPGIKSKQKLTELFMAVKNQGIQHE